MVDVKTSARAPGMTTTSHRNVHIHEGTYVPFHACMYGTWYAAETLTAMKALIDHELDGCTCTMRKPLQPCWTD